MVTEMTMMTSHPEVVFYWAQEQAVGTCTLALEILAVHNTAPEVSMADLL